MKQLDLFDVLSADEAKKVRESASTTGSRPLSPVTKSLLEGNTVFLIGRQSYNTKTFTKLGKRLRSARGQRGENEGVYIWLEDIGTNGTGK